MKLGLEENQKPYPLQCYDSYQVLTVRAKEVFNQVSWGNLLCRPEPIKLDLNRRNKNKYCKFHVDVGHNTNDCTNLKDEIEKLIREGRLQEFKVDRRSRGHGNNGWRRENNQRGEDRELVGVIRTILGGPNLGGTQEDPRRITSTRKDRCIKKVFGASQLPGQQR